MPIIETFLIGHKAEPSLEAIASLRLDIFREYPYLYEGLRDDELRYLRSYAEKPGACVILVEDAGKTIGAATGMPLKHEDQHLLDSFAGTAHLIDKSYYVGELLFYRDYRHRGFGSRLLARIEEYVRSLGPYSHLVCMTVMRPPDHLLCPADYAPIERFLARTGFVPMAGITSTIAWREIDGVRRDHLLQFWRKDLSWIYQNDKAKGEQLCPVK